MNVKQMLAHSATMTMMIVMATVVTVVVAAAVLVVLLPCASADEADTLCGYIPLDVPEEPDDDNLAGNLGFASEAEAEHARMCVLGDPPVGSLPQAYDARDLGYVTPVRSQSSCGSCWIFAAVADFESDVAIREPSGLPDYSEQEIGDCNIWSSVGGYEFCSGGNAFMTTNYLTKYGAADEADHPYAAAAESCRDSPVLKNVNGWRRITGSSGESQSYRNTIKQAILDYGPIYSTINSSSPGFGSYSSGVYEAWNTTGYTNHAVQIVGWDDMISHSQGPGAGAWLIKNSWDDDWGILGYAWVAYGSANLGDYTSAIAGYGDSGDTIYYHDECGWMGYSYGSSDPSHRAGYGAARFTPSENITLVAVDFWAVGPGMSYEIRIFDTLTDIGSGNYNFSIQIGGAETGTTNESGYYSIPLGATVPLTAGDDVIVQVRLEKAPGASGHPIPIDYTTESWLPDWSTIAEFSNESYYSDDGAIFTKPDPYDIGIRARARHCYNPPTISVDDGIENTTGGDCGDCVGAGDFINYMICYDNLPNPVESLTNITIVDSLPLNVTFVSASAGGVYDPVVHSVTWVIGSLAGGRCGGDACVTLNVTVNPHAWGTTLTNCATITSDETEPATVCGGTGVREPHEPVPVTTPVGAMFLIGFMAMAGCVVMKRGA